MSWTLTSAPTFYGDMRYDYKRGTAVLLTGYSRKWWLWQTRGR